MSSGDNARLYNPITDWHAGSVSTAVERNNPVAAAGILGGGSVSAAVLVSSSLMLTSQWLNAINPFLLNRCKLRLSQVPLQVTSLVGVMA